MTRTSGLFGCFETCEITLIDLCEQFYGLHAIYWHMRFVSVTAHSKPQAEPSQSRCRNTVLTHSHSKQRTRCDECDLHGRHLCRRKKKRHLEVGCVTNLDTNILIWEIQLANASKHSPTKTFIYPVTSPNR